MKEKAPIHQNHVVKRSLEAVVKPWAKLPQPDVVTCIETTSIPVIEIARHTGLSVQRILNERPHTIAVSDNVFVVKKASTVHPQSVNLRMKRLVRESVREPAIKGVRNSRKRLNEKTFSKKVEQAKQEREKLVFRSTTDQKKGNEQRRTAIHARVAERFSHKFSTNGHIPVDLSSNSLQTLRSLVQIGINDIQQVAQNALDNPHIQLFDFAEMLGLPNEIVSRLKENAKLVQLTSSSERVKEIATLQKLINETPTLHSLSKDRINPATPFEGGVPLFFGMGGGSQMPCQGLPIDVLKMVFTSEKLRRELGLSQCFVLGADVITYTNIGRTPGFTKEKVDQVIGTEVTLLNEVFRRFGFTHWKATRQSQLGEHFPEEKVEEWKRNIQEADTVPFVGGHHYAIEMSDIQLIVPNGIKLGWWIRPLTKGTGYIMDEQPFHARFALVMGLLNKPHATTLLYTHAGSRILLGEDGLLQKEAPYITYTPNRRLLLSPFEDIGRKLVWAERRGGGLTLPFVREQMSAMVDLFEELVTEIPATGKTKDEILANKLQFIVNEGVGNDSRLEKMWQEAFPNSL